MIDKKQLSLMLIGITLIISLFLILSVGATTVNIETADAGQLTGTYDTSGGTYLSTQADDNSYYFVGTAFKSTAVNAYIELNFSLTSLGILEGAITNLTFSAVYCHDGTSVGGSCTGDNAEGTADGTQNVEVYNYSSSAWVDIGDLRTDDNGNEVSGDWSVNTGWSDFVDSNNVVTVRFEMDWNNTAGGSDDAFLNLDYATLNVTYHRPPNVTSLDLPADNGYSNSATVDFNFTAESDYGFTNCTLYGNWTGTWHANTTIYNTTINNGTTTNITIPSIAEGTYIWNVLCYDNATTIQSDWFDSNYTFVLDTTNPTITLNSPDNDIISQDSFKLLNITVTDNRDEIIVKIYGGSETSFFSNNSLLYKRTGVANGTEITYNWTAPVLNVTSDAILLMHLDNEGKDNETHIYDETGINNGTKLASNSPAWNESGKFGYALGFDGVDDSVTISDSNSLDLNNSFSISFWAYPTDLSNNQTFLAKGSSTATNYYIDYKTTTEIEFGFYNSAWRSVAVSASSFTANQWNLITVTRNSSSNISTIYINGVDKGNLQLDYAPLANSNALKLGSFPGYDQNYTGLIDELIIYNKTLTASEVTNIYQLSNGNWYWRVDLNDTASNLNISEMRTFEVGSVWTISPTDLGSVGTSLDTNVSVGILTINNTHASRNVTINITSDYSGNVYFNETLPLNLTGAGGNWTRIQINVTSPSTEGSTTINFNSTATDYSGVGSIPASRIVPVVLVATSAQPFLITNFETYPTTVSQNNTGISLKASVINRGQGNAQNVQLTFKLPSGWTNSSSALTQSLGILTVNEQKNASVTVDVNSTATSGIVTLYANVSGQNSTGDTLTSSYLSVDSVNVTVNAISVGAGPTTTTTTTTGGTVGGGGGGSGRVSSAGGSIESVAFSEAIEIVRGAGGEASFNILITPKYINSTLENLILTLTGFLEQYIAISPLVIRKIKYREVQNFTITLSAPSYKSYEEHNLTATIKGNLVRGNITSQYLDTRTIRLIIHELAEAESKTNLKEAEKAIQEMKYKGFNIKKVEKLLLEAEEKFSFGMYGESKKLADEILKTKEIAFKAHELIENIKLVLQSPRKIWKVLTGKAIQEAKELEKELESGKVSLTGRAIVRRRLGIEEINESELGDRKVSLTGRGGQASLTGQSTIFSETIVDTLLLSIINFEKGDYEKALEIAEKAQVLLILERKGSLRIFLYLYWWALVIGFIAFTITSIFSYKKYVKTTISKKIENSVKEQENIRNLVIEAQESYFKGKISAADYKNIMSQNSKRLLEIKKREISLRNKRVRILKPEQVLKDLEQETAEIIESIKKLQEDYFVKRKIAKQSYDLGVKAYNERLAEIESERLSLETLFAKKRKRKEKPKKRKKGKELEEAMKEAREKIKQAREIVKKPEKKRRFFNKILDFLTFRFVKRKIKEKREKKEKEIREKVKNILKEKQEKEVENE